MYKIYKVCRKRIIGYLKTSSLEETLWMIRFFVFLLFIYVALHAMSRSKYYHN